MLKISRFPGEKMESADHFKIFIPISECPSKPDQNEVIRYKRITSQFVLLAELLL